MYFGATNTGVGIWWLVLSMLICTILEGFVFHSTRVFRRPYMASMALNGLSMVVGVPLTFVGALVDFMITATALTILVEVVAAVAWSSQRTINGAVSSTRRTILSVVGGNILSNAALFLLLGVMFDRYPPRYVYEIQCQRNLNVLQSAELEYEAATGTTNGSPITQNTLLPYLPGGIWPDCPFHGTYQLGRVGDKPTCTHDRHDKPVRTQRMPNKKLQPAPYEERLPRPRPTRVQG